MKLMKSCLMGKSFISRSKKLLWVSMDGAMEIVMVPYNRKRTAKGSEKYNFQKRRSTHFNSSRVFSVHVLNDRMVGWLRYHSTPSIIFPAIVGSISVIDLPINSFTHIQSQTAKPKERSYIMFMRYVKIA
jgi:hypothetical protein